MHKYGINYQVNITQEKVVVPGVTLSVGRIKTEGRGGQIVTGKGQGGVIMSKVMGYKGNTNINKLKAVFEMIYIMNASS